MVWKNLKKVKLGNEKKFLEKVSKVVFHRFLGEISLKKWFFKIFAKIIKNFFLPQLLGAVASLKVNRFSIF